MQAECSDDVMKLTVNFNASFEGLIYSAGYAYDDDCIYIKGTGDNQYEFYIQLNRCGTLGGSDHNKKRDVLNGKNTDPTVSTLKSRFNESRFNEESRFKERNLVTKMKFDFKKSRFRVKSRFKKWKGADGGHSLNRDFTTH